MVTLPWAGHTSRMSRLLAFLPTACGANGSHFPILLSSSSSGD